MRKVSLALWPTASSRRLQGIVSLPFTSTPERRPSLVRRPVTALWNRTSPPREIISSRMAFTAPGRRSVPMWGLASHKISRGAPAAANSRSTRRARASLVPVFSFPSEKVPAPPSPNCTLVSVSKRPVLQKRSTALARSSTQAPRSSTRGRWPARARIRAANRPAGPNPATTGRCSICRHRGISYRKGTASLTFGSLGGGSFPSTPHSTVQMKCTSFFFLASTERRTSSREAMRSGETCSRLAASFFSASSPAPRGRERSDTL